MDQNNNDFTFYDLFDIAEIQQIQDDIARTLHIASFVVAPDGTPITKPSNFCSFCYNVVRSTEKGCANCIKSDSIIGAPNPNGPTIAHCLSAGLIDASCSIIVNGKHVGSWLIGQVRNSDIPMSRERNIEYANAIGVDPELYCREYEKVPAMPLSEFTNLVNLLFIIVKQISSLAHQNVLKKQEINRRILLEEKLKEEHDKLVYSSTHDLFCDIYNRMHFDDLINSLDRTSEFPISIIMGDINNLKATNDVFGHKEGDLLIKTICNIMKEHAKDNYHICRYGGDEFTVVLPGADAKETEEYCKAVQKACRQCSDTMITPYISFGYATKITPTMSLHSVLRKADKLMYINKAKDKAAYSIFDDINRIIIDKKKYVTEQNHQLGDKLAKEFAKYINLSEKETGRLINVMKYKDLGLVSIPPNIFFNENLKAKDDFVALRNYALVSYRLAKLTDETYSSAEGILHHHEYYNGSGFPSQLSGDDIPYISRISLIVDQYIQQTSTGAHCYNRSKEEAIKIMKESSGILYDPEILEKFLDFITAFNDFDSND